MKWRKHGYGTETQAPCKVCGADAYEACGRDPSPMDIRAIDLALTRPEAWALLRALALQSNGPDAAVCNWIAQRLQTKIQAAGWTLQEPAADKEGA